VVDRLIQQALHQVLSPLFELQFSQSSYGYRPGKSAHQAIAQAKDYILQGKRWVVDMDLAKFFDEVNHDILMSRVAKESVIRFRANLKGMFSKGRGRNLGKFIREDLNPLVKGWIHYFSIVDVKIFAEELDGWIRRRLRLILWRQWKRPWTRRKRMIAAGLSEERAVMSAFNCRGPWWNSGASHMNDILRKKFFDRQGLVSMVDELCKFRTTKFKNRIGT
jgi:hypothetical protein